MKIAYQIAAELGGTGLGRVASHAVEAIHEAGMLGAVTCLSHRMPAIADSHFHDVQAVRTLNGILPRRLANKLAIRSLLHQNYFGARASHNLGGCSIVHGFAGQMTETIRVSRRSGTRTIVDRPNTHVAFMRRALEQEYRKYDVPFAPYTRMQIRRETRELLDADAVVTCSEFAKRTMLTEGVHPDKIHVIPYGVDTDAFRPEPKGDGIFRAVFVGHICLRKGVQYLLEAWEILRFSDAELVLQGHLLDDAAVLVKHYRGRFPFTIRPHTDSADELCRLYNSASICVFPSVEDGFGMVVTEAMACNRPVIITGNMGATDVVADGINGMIIPAASTAALVEALHFLHRNRDSSLGATNRERVKSLRWSAYRASLLALYHDLMGTGEP